MSSSLMDDIDLSDIFPFLFDDSPLVENHRQTEENHHINIEQSPDHDRFAKFSLVTPVPNSQTNTQTNEGMAAEPVDTFNENSLMEAYNQNLQSNSTEHFMDLANVEGFLPQNLHIMDWTSVGGFPPQDLQSNSGGYLMDSPNNGGFPPQNLQSEPPVHLMDSTNVGEFPSPTFHGNSLSAWPVPTIPFSCSCCHVLREIIHIRGIDVTKLEIHGTVGMVSHAILENRYGIDCNGNTKREYQMFDFCKKSIEDVREFLIQYCEDRRRSGHELIQDPLLVFYEALSVGMFTDDYLDIADFFPPPSGFLGVGASSSGGNDANGGANVNGGANDNGGGASTSGAKGGGGASTSGAKSGGGASTFGTKSGGGASTSGAKSGGGASTSGAKDGGGTNANGKNPIFEEGVLPPPPAPEQQPPPPAPEQPPPPAPEQPPPPPPPPPEQQPSPPPEQPPPPPPPEQPQPPPEQPQPPPQRRQNEGGRGRRTSLALQRERTGRLALGDLRGYFNLPMEVAARRMKVCPTVMKKICRREGLPRWPYRKVNSLERKVIAKTIILNLKMGEERKRVQAEIDRLQKEIDETIAGILDKNKSG